MKPIKGILIDFGNVLGDSATGYWYLAPNFLETVGKEKFNRIPHKTRKEVFKSAWKNVCAVSTVKTLDHEKLIFKKFYSTLAEGFPTLPIRDNMEQLIDDMVINYKKYVFFDDTYKVLPSLAKKYSICLVSDAWPSLRMVFKGYLLDKYFVDMIISSEIGVTKPNEKMYTKALESLGLNHDEVVFIDDKVSNCIGAEKLGIKSFVLERRIKYRLYDKVVKNTNIPIVKNMYQLENEIKKLNQENNDENNG